MDARDAPRSRAHAYLLTLAHRYLVDDQEGAGADLGRVREWLVPALQAHQLRRGRPMSSWKSAAAVRKTRRVVRRASDATIELTASARLLPDFLIVGRTAVRHDVDVQDAGAASRVSPARSCARACTTSTSRTTAAPRWYRGHFPLAATSRCAPRGRTPLTGESAPYYMFHPLAGERIAPTCPAYKLLVLLRDPVERAYSGHSHELGAASRRWRSRRRWTPSRSGSQDSETGCWPSGATRAPTGSTMRT